jgi:FAD/FMN-containing dehydrogenase
VTSYFSNQQRFTVPACIVRPTSALEISSALRTVKEYGCHFAVKSGGHAAFKGASNADGGITIDLVGIRDLEISEDKGTTRVGTGLRWGEVYEKMEPNGLTVVGGRDQYVGVGGFLLGGQRMIVLHGEAYHN